MLIQALDEVEATPQILQLKEVHLVVDAKAAVNSPIYFDSGGDKRMVFVPQEKLKRILEQPIRL